MTSTSTSSAAQVDARSRGIAMLLGSRHDQITAARIAERLARPLPQPGRAAA